MIVVFFFQAEDGIRDLTVTGVQTCALPISFDLAGVNRPRLDQLAQPVRQLNLAGPIALGGRERRKNIWRQRSEEHTSELQSQSNLVCRLLLEKKKNDRNQYSILLLIGLYDS